MSEPTIRNLPVHLVRPGDNDRKHFDEKKLEDLAANIAEHGLAQPPTVRPIWVCKICTATTCVATHLGESDESPGHCEHCQSDELEFYYEIVAGERRFRAVSQILEWDEIPAIVRELDDEAASAIMLAENVHRVDLNPLDEASAYRKRIDQFNWTPAEVAKHANVSLRRVSDRLLLLDLVPDIQKLIADGQLSVGYGEAMAPLDANRQHVAIKYFETTKKPLLREFRAVVGKLLQEQAQETMFDLDALVVEAVEEHNAQRDAHLDRRFPVDEALPAMEKTGTVGLSFETYLAQLLTSEDPHHRDAAAIVGRIYDSMLAAGMAFPPRQERGDPLKDVTW